jgi:hypothetical protein
MWEIVTIEFTKRADGRTVLRCIRDDGSVTWQRNENERALFFPVHDLMHYAVETELGFHRGFFGLVAEGWEIIETTGKTPRGPLPNETLAVEYLVSAFSAEQAGNTAASANEFNQLAATFANARGMAPARELSESELAGVRTRFTELAVKWRDLPAGATLELSFSL